MSQPNLFDDLKSEMLTIGTQEVILDQDLAKFFETDFETFQMTIFRNSSRFPQDLMFEHEGHLMFTWPGICMAAGLIQSPKAIRIHIELIREFTKLYQEITGKSFLESFVEMKGDLEKLNLQTEEDVVRLVHKYREERKKRMPENK